MDRIVPTFLALFTCRMLHAALPVVIQSSSLDGAHGIAFGMAQEQVIEIMGTRYKLKPAEGFLRDEFDVLVFKKVPQSSVDGLRVFINPRSGVFWIEEEVLLRWNLQKDDQDNLENHTRSLHRVLGQLKRRYGKEALSERTDITSRFLKNDFVKATWLFKENRWIHVIYEPQDWEITPEINKVIVIYHDPSLDPRSR